MIHQSNQKTAYTQILPTHPRNANLMITNPILSRLCCLHYDEAGMFCGEANISGNIYRDDDHRCHMPPRKYNPPVAGFISSNVFFNSVNSSSAQPNLRLCTTSTPQNKSAFQTVELIPSTTDNQDGRKLVSGKLSKA